MPHQRPHHGPDPADALHAVHELGRQLTVVYAWAQLLQRYIEQSRIEDAADCLVPLKTIEASAGQMRARLHELMAIIEHIQGERTDT